MAEVRLGKTNMRSMKNAFGALPIQRVSAEYAAMLLRKAYRAGITFFDTARAYTDSEEKIGLALADVRQHIAIATKTGAKTPEDFWAHLHASLTFLKTDYIDIYQFHNPTFCPKPGDGSGLYEAMLQAKKQGKIRWIGITSHRLAVAREAVDSGLYDTLQFPFCYLSTAEEINLVQHCAQADVGFIAMKALSGGLISNAGAAYAWLDQYANVLPIWGIQQERELDEFIRYIQNPPVLNAAHHAAIARDRNALMGNFCRACGYCMPCPAGIDIPTCARMSQLIRRSPSDKWLNQDGQRMMRKIEDCIACGKCSASCPYDLQTPALLAANLADYRQILADRAAAKTN
jgi:Predicted oxidoreductases of the aldo/keto reductase family